MDSLKHGLHCCVFGVFIVISVVMLSKNRPEGVSDPLARYGISTCVVLYTLKLLTLLALPISVFNFVGLTLYNAFKTSVALRHEIWKCPPICIRVVTRGNYPELIRKNLRHNLKLCEDLQLPKISMEIVTDNPVCGDNRVPKLTQIVVPKSYRSKSGALYKARALQYCHELGVSKVDGEDWIVHLDEETLLTPNSLRGIVNFVVDDQGDIGQGLITYANQKIVNWVTTCMDFLRVADDMGKLRLQLKYFHRPLFSFKGSFVVVKAKIEKRISFDNGLEGSIAEDCFFAMKAHSLGYKFDFIEGEMWEKSPFSFLDFIQQRKRWVQGTLLVAHSKEIPFRYKACLVLSSYLSVLLPILVINGMLHTWFPLPVPIYYDIYMGFVSGVQIYMYIYGALKSLTLKKLGWFLYSLCLVLVATIIPVVNVVLENISIVWAIFGNKYGFYVVNKSCESNIVV